MRVGVYVCTTLQSPLLLRTLLAIADQKLPQDVVLEAVTLVINMSEEDYVQSKDRLDELLLQARMAGAPVEVVHETSMGIPYARNKALEHAAQNTVRYVAFIDDDCVPDSDWLAHLAAPILSSSSDASAGSWRLIPEGASVSPFLPRSTWGRKDYLVQGDFAEDLSLLPHAFTRSVLFDRRVNTQIEQLRFDEDRAELGGSDVLFFAQYVRLGGSIRYAQTSLVTEYYSDDRLTLKWHFWRKWRNAQFVLERSRSFGEFIYLPLSPQGLPLALLLIVSGARVKLFSRRGKKRFFVPSFSPGVIGYVVFRIAQVSAVIAMDLGIRHRNYRRKNSAKPPIAAEVVLTKNGRAG